MNSFWERVYLGGIAEDLTTHATVDDLLVLDVVVREHAEYQCGEDDENSDTCSNHRVGQVSIASFALSFSRSTARDFYLYGHRCAIPQFRNVFERRGVAKGPLVHFVVRAVNGVRTSRLLMRLIL